MSGEPKTDGSDAPQATAPDGATSKATQPRSDPQKAANRPGPAQKGGGRGKGRGRGGGGQQPKEAEVRVLRQANPDAPAQYGRKPLSEGLRQRRRAQRARRARAMGIVVGVPTLLSALYFGLLASNQYESVSAFTVQSADGRTATGLEQVLGALPGGSSSSKDVLIVREYILSRDMLAYLVDSEQWRAHYSQEGADFLARLDPNSDSESVYEDYLKRLEVTHDTSSDALTMKLRGFTADAAERFSRAILERSEAAVNRLARKAREDAIAFAVAEVESARDRVEAAREKLLNLQGEDAEFNPLQSAQALQGLRAHIEGELASKRAELSALSSFMNPKAPQVVELRQQVRSLEREIERQRKRLVDPSKADGVNESIAKYEPALFEKEFAERALQSALTSLELARVDASRQHRYLVTIAKPSRPDAPTHPHRLLGILTVLLVTLVAASIGALVLATVREHART